MKPQMLCGLAVGLPAGIGCSWKEGSFFRLFITHNMEYGLKIYELELQNRIQPKMWIYLTVRHICFKMQIIPMKWNITLWLFYMRLRVCV